jgi:hypothetical protein
VSVCVRVCVRACMCVCVYVCVCVCVCVCVGDDLSDSTVIRSTTIDKWPMAVVTGNSGAIGHGACGGVGGGGEAVAA